jgi:hypothetical protein
MADQYGLGSVAVRAYLRSNIICPDGCYKVVDNEVDSCVDRLWDVMQYATDPS